MKNKKVFDNAEKLILAYKNGVLGGEFMPEDSNPGYDKSSKENYLYFTLPMALNYQRNSYTLWESAKKTVLDTDLSDVFDPAVVVNMPTEELKEKLTRYKLALQPNKQPAIWKTLCITFYEKYDSDIRNFFAEHEYSVENIKNFMLKNKKMFPYLSGNKIVNYWLYVMTQYTDCFFIDRVNISVAPDTHVIQASYKLGLINDEELRSSKVQQIVADKWQELFKNTDYEPIDIHTPLWLWSRNGFVDIF